MAMSPSSVFGRFSKFVRKDYRDGYLANHVRGSIPLQIRALRQKSDMSQAEFAVATGKKQSTISRLEDTTYGRVSVQTLIDIATATNVALVVRFVDYPEFFRITGDMSLAALAPDDVFQSLAKERARTATEFLARVFPKVDQQANSPQLPPQSPASVDQLIQMAWPREVNRPSQPLTSREHAPWN